MRPSAIYIIRERHTGKNERDKKNLYFFFIFLLSTKTKNPENININKGIINVVISTTGACIPNNGVVIRKCHNIKIVLTLKKIINLEYSVNFFKILIKPIPNNVNNANNDE